MCLVLFWRLSCRCSISAFWGARFCLAFTVVTFDVQRPSSPQPNKLRMCQEEEGIVVAYDVEGKRMVERL